MNHSKQNQNTMPLINARMLANELNIRLLEIWVSMSTKPSNISLCSLATRNRLGNRIPLKQTKASSQETWTMFLKCLIARALLPLPLLWDHV